MAAVMALPRYSDRGRPFLAFVYGIAAHKVADAYRAAGRDRADPTANAAGSPVARSRIPSRWPSMPIPRARMSELLALTAGEAARDPDPAGRRRSERRGDGRSRRQHRRSGAGGPTPGIGAAEIRDRRGGAGLCLNYLESAAQPALDGGAQRAVHRRVGHTVSRSTAIPGIGRWPDCWRTGATVCELADRHGSALSRRPPLPWPVGWPHVAEPAAARRLMGAVAAAVLSIGGFGAVDRPGAAQRAALRCPNVAVRRAGGGAR